MTFRVISNIEGHIGDATAPTKTAAIEFLKGEGIEAGTYELEELAKMVTVKFYKTVRGVDRLWSTRHFETVEDAIKAVDAWEEETPDHYAVYS